MNKKKQKYTAYTTPKGTASWAKLTVQEEWQGKPTGKYSIRVDFSKEDTDEILERCEAEYERLKKAGVFKDFKPGRNTVPNFGEKEDANGNIYFKFTTKAEFKNSKTNEVMPRTVPVFDASLRPLKSLIGNGSQVKVRILMVPKMQDSKNYGLALWMDAVQVIDLVEYGSGASTPQDYGFDVENDYEGHEEEEGSGFEIEEEAGNEGVERDF